jgi:hypothetical protein
LRIVGLLPVVGAACLVTPVAVIFLHARRSGDLAK